MRIMKIFEFIINPEDQELGMKAISIVDRPAMESEFIAFNKTEKKVRYKLKDEKKYIVSGLALIPDKLIYRVDEDGEDYLGYFSAETIEMIVSKFMKESTNGTLENVNLQHDGQDKVQAHLIESFILRTSEMVDAVKAMGIEEAVLGAWFVSYKFDNKEDYDKAVSEEFTGFSVEVVLQRELKLNKNNNNNNKLMTKVKSFIDKFKNILAELEDGEVKLEDGKIADSDIVLRWGEVGQPVLKVLIAEDGTETTEAMPEGEYILEGGNTLVVDAQGNLVEIKEGEAPASIPEEEMSAEDKAAEAKKKEDELAAQKLAEEEQKKTTSDLDKTLRELIPADKNGDYSIMVSVVDGELKYGAMSSWTEIKMKAESDKQAEIDLLKAEVESLKTENTEVKEKLSKIVVKPIFTEFTQPKAQDNYKAKNNLDYHLHKLGLDKEK